MGIGGSKDEKIQVNPIKIPGRYLQPLKNVNTRSGDVRTAQRDVAAAKAQADNYVKYLSDVSGQLSSDIDMLKNKKAGVNALLALSKQSQSTYTNRNSQLAALQHSSETGSKLALMRNSLSAISAIKARR